MAANPAQLQFVNERSSDSWDGGSGFTQTYQAQYIVTTTDPQDNVLQVFAAPGLPKIGDPFTAGSTSDMKVYCASRAPSRDAKDPCTWYVQCEFRSPKFNPNNPDKGSDDPFNWRDEVSIDSAKFTGPVTKALLYRDLPGLQKASNPGDTIDIDGITPINAAGDPLNPPLERDMSRTIVKIRKYMANYPSGIESVVDTLNSTSLTISKPGFTFTFGVHQGKLEPTKGSLKYHRSRQNVIIPYWEVDLAIAFNSNSWAVDAANLDTDQRALAGNKDGHGGTLSSAQIVPGQPLKRAIKDINGHSIHHPVPLDLNGDPLGPNKPHTFIRYQIYDFSSTTADWASFNWNTDNTL